MQSTRVQSRRPARSDSCLSTESAISPEHSWPFALPTADPGSIPCTLHGSPWTARIQEYRAKRKLWVQWGVAKKGSRRFSLLKLWAIPSFLSNVTHPRKFNSLHLSSAIGTCLACLTPKSKTQLNERIICLGHKNCSRLHPRQKGMKKEMMVALTSPKFMETILGSQEWKGKNEMLWKGLNYLELYEKLFSLDKYFALN